MSNVQIPSIDAFNCPQFRQLFNANNRNGVITTTNNGRKYNVVWESSTNTISVKRDLNNIGCWSRFSETLERWAQGDLTSHAEKWESRLAIQQKNVMSAKPLDQKVTALLVKTEQFNTEVKFSQSLSNTLQEPLLPVSLAFTQLLENNRQQLHKQAQQLSKTVNQHLTSDRLWTQEQEVNSAAGRLQKQTEQLGSFSLQIDDIVASYSAALSAVDVSKSSSVCAAILIRINSFTTKISKIVNDYFSLDEKQSDTDVINKFNQLIQNELDIAATLASPQFFSHFHYNQLLPSFYEEGHRKETSQEARIKFNYQTQSLLFITTLVDINKTPDDIKDATDALKLASVAGRD